MEGREIPDFGGVVNLEAGAEAFRCFGSDSVELGQGILWNPTLVLPQNSSDLVTTHHGLVVVRQWDSENVDHGGSWASYAVKLSNVKSAFEPESARVIAVGI